MAYSLSSERPDTAAASFVNPFRAFARWMAGARAKRAQRIALSTLLDYDGALLDDLGIDRGDVIAALQHPNPRTGAALAARRARASRDWLFRS